MPLAILCVAVEMLSFSVYEGEKRKSVVISEYH